jgi:hypothetical protein
VYGVCRDAFVNSAAQITVNLNKIAPHGLIDLAGGWLAALCIFCSTFSACGRPGKTKALRKPGRIGRSEQFCTDAVGQQAHVEQRLGARPPALLPVKSILQVSGPSRGWLSVWGFFMLRNSAFPSKQSSDKVAEKSSPKLGLGVRAKWARWPSGLLKKQIFGRRSAAHARLISDSGKRT